MFNCVSSASFSISRPFIDIFPCITVEASAFLTKILDFIPNLSVPLSNHSKSSLNANFVLFTSNFSAAIVVDLKCVLVNIPFNPDIFKLKAFFSSLIVSLPINFVLFTSNFSSVFVGLKCLFVKTFCIFNSPIFVESNFTSPENIFGENLVPSPIKIVFLEFVAIFK